jgi:hypothetical protein
LDSGLAAFLGAIAGAAASLGGIVVTDLLQARRRAREAEPKRALLRKMLGAGHNWRRLSTLSNVTGLSEQEAKQLLVEIGARGSETDSSLWGLVSRNPLPGQDPDPG